MELDVKDRHLRVHYSERLVQLLREARQLAALGFPVAAKIQHTASTAWKFYHHAVVLKQVRLVWKKIANTTSSPCYLLS